MFGCGDKARLPWSFVSNSSLFLRLGFSFSCGFHVFIYIKYLNTMLGLSTCCYCVQNAHVTCSVPRVTVGRVFEMLIAA